MVREKLVALREAGVYLQKGEAVKDIRSILDRCRNRGSGGGISQETRDVADRQAREAMWQPRIVHSLPREKG